ncbi:unnamed protein product [Adineta steineri]|uniref:G-protein coupled receptors family 1 profile domain-containing protein n=1 Tax=Adineta steineri TaxID=433720 RepID=A0A818Q3Q6_9BILA|nr:unnamed protein product [Adineta steineri]
MNDDFSIYFSVTPSSPKTNSVVVYTTDNEQPLPSLLTQQTTTPAEELPFDHCASLEIGSMTLRQDEIAVETARIRRKWIEEKDTLMARLVADITKPKIGSIYQWETLVNSDDVVLDDYLPENIPSFFQHNKKFLTISLTILTSIYGDDATGRFFIWCKLRYILGQTCAVTTLYMICFTAVDQFFSTNHRLNLRQMCTLKLGRYFAFIFICFAIIHGIVDGSSYDIQSTLGCVPSTYVAVQYSTFFFYPILVGFLSIVIASSFSVLAYHNVRHIVRRQLPIVRRKLDKQITAMVLMRVIVFVCLVLPYVTYRIYTVNFPTSRKNNLHWYEKLLFVYQS